MNLSINGQTFAAEFADTKAAAEFAALLPLALDMSDYNRNEKVATLPKTLTAADTAVKRIEAGDILLWQGNSIVVFYESFDTPYRYTRIGKITDAAGLKAALGAGNTAVRFSR
ncbi:hypothetical protein A7P95_02035 [Eikenella longinqua]|uniref:Cyclophilin-like domain-containing protein n=2 Tax=Eikenella longinqua TaxID=1795827 RepID=A0A1A9S1S8_9NEIS|nr:hypothetical protein A7P95_02035 [Eikenella longinqua]